MRYLRKFGGFLVLLALLMGAPTEVHAQTVGNCEPALAEQNLDINNVRARIFNNGNLFWRGSPNVYEVPKDGGANALFNSGIWLAGTVGGQLRAAAARYGNYNFWAGPLDDAGNPPADCGAFDRMYKVSRNDIEEYEATGVATSALRDWPTGLGAPTLDADGNRIEILSQPFATRSGRVIDLASGERPAILGDQSIWWVMNDRGNQHEAPSSDTPPIGLEVQAMVFAFNTSGDIGNTTFYKYDLYYKGAQPLENAYMGLYSDPDLGDAFDDYVGSDTTLGMGFVYNADNNDGTASGYGEAPPATGYDFFQGPIVPAVGDTAQVSGVKIADFKNLKMTHFVYYNNGGGVTEDPGVGTDYYNYLQGRWKDGKQITLGGNGRDFSETPTDFMYTGDPVAGEFWSEFNADGNGTAIEPNDRRFVMSTGPFTINPGDFQQIVFGIVWARGADNLDSVSKMRQADALAQAAFDVNFELPQPPAAPALSATPLDGKVTLEWVNSTRSNNYLESYAAEDPFAPDEDDDYQFEGYDIFQFNNEQDQIGRLIGTYDVDNGITRVVDGIPGEPSSVTANGNNSGVRRYHIVGGLTNYTTYHFGVQAYAYNELSSPKVYRGPMARLSVVPARSLEVISDAARDAADEGIANPDIIAEKQGIGGGTVTAHIVNEGAVTGDTYRVEFLAAEAGKGFVSPFGEEADSEELSDVVPAHYTPSKTAEVAATVTTYDVYRGSTKIFDGVTDAVDITGHAAPQGQNVQLIDGLSFNIAGPASRELQFEDQGLVGDHAPVFVEVQGPGGADPCGVDAGSTFGCAEAGGNWVWASFNGTGEYIMTSIGGGPDESIDTFAPQDYEIRVTTTGSYGVYGFGSDEEVDNHIWTPVEVWDIGPTGPFNENDPSDDIQMIPVLFSDGEGDGVFAYGQAEAFSRPASDRIYSYYASAGSSYDDWATIVQPNVDAAPDGIWNDPAGEQWNLIDFGRGRPLQRVVFVDNTGGAKDVADLVGAIVRFHTTKPHLPGDVFTLNTAGLGATAPDLTTQQARLDEIGIVPNPYLGASSYEVSQLTDQVRFTNLPDVATIRIFTLNGSLIRTLEKQSAGVATLTWDMTTENQLPIASGVYLIHVEVPNVGERVLKFAAVKKRIQLNTF